MRNMVADFLHFHKSYEAGDCQIDDISRLKEILVWRNQIMKAAMGMREDYAAVSCVMETLFKRAAGCHTVLRPCDFLYMGLQPANEKTVESCTNARDKFVRLTGIVRREEMVDKLIPLMSMKQVDEAIETLMVLAQVIQGDRNPPGPATPPPDN
ncbi:hypothetical protein [Vibrio phage vB_pir03]|nr:hypothetical protein [Vibrio phage vB_pir03]